MSKLEPLIIGDLIAERPIIQGGMGVGISLSSLAGAVAKAGGIGVISTAQIGFREKDFAEHPQKANLRAIGSELKKAREIAPDGVLGFNIMVATRDYELYVKEAVKAGADIIISGAGLPVDLPAYAGESNTKLAPIVSSAKSARVICRLWDRKYKRVPDLVVIEGPLAGGHLGFSRDELHDYGADTGDVSISFKKEAYEAEIKKIMEVTKEFGDKYNKKIPVVTAGGIYDGQDVTHHIRDLGADGVQVATRFVTTEECDAPMAYKDAYITAGKEDIVITKSPVGMPGRAIKNKFLSQVGEEPAKIDWCYQCLEHCNPAKIPYCITRALVNAALGNIEEALLFCGSNAYRAERIETVSEVMADLCGE
ncbi:nitronate monooxygenase family protein [Lachnospiraceae bacterium 62-35]